MNRRYFLTAIGAAIMLPRVIKAQEMRMDTIFRLNDPTDILYRYVRLLREPRDFRDQNEELAKLAIEDPVALWIVVTTVVPEISDPDASAAWITKDAEALWGPLSEPDLERVRSLCLAAADHPLDGNSAAIALSDTRADWFDTARFFEQIEAISRNFPPIRAKTDFEAWSDWRIPVSSLSFALGYDGGASAPREGSETDAAMLTPYLFDSRSGKSVELARRFQQSEIADSLLFAWFYAPSFEIYLAYGELPDTLSAPVEDASPRLAEIYVTVNTRQMRDFADREEEMMQ